MTVIDQTKDTNGQTLHRLVKLYEVPDFVKSASIEDVTGINLDLPTEVYGDPRTRQFPTHTPAAVYTSMLYLTEAREHLGKMASVIEDRIAKSARFFGVDKHVERINTKYAEMSKKSIDSLPDDEFAAVVVYENGTRERHMPIRNAQEIKAASEFLKKHRSSFVYDDRRLIAERILRKSGSVGGLEGDTREWLLKQAGWACGPAQKAAEMLFDRAKALRLLRRDVPLQEELVKAAQYCLANPTHFHQSETMQKIASMIDHVDRENNFHNTPSLGEPEDLFAFTVKEASDFADSHVQLISGSVYEKSALSSAFDLNDIRDILGADFANRVAAGGLFIDNEKLAEELRVMPLGDARLFDRLAEAVQLKPITKEAAADDKPSFLQAMAALHQG